MSRKAAKDIDIEALDFYAKELREASQARDTLKVAQTIKNIQDLTHWGVERLGSKFKISPMTVWTYLKLLELPDALLNAWSANKMATTVALAFLKVPEGLRLPLFEELRRREIPLTALKENLHTIIRQTTRDGVVPKTAETESEPEPVAAPPALEPKPKMGPEIVEQEVVVGPLHRLAFTGRAPGDGLLVTGHIADATGALIRIQKLSSSEIELDLIDRMDRDRARQNLRQLIANAEIALSILEHIDRAHGVRESVQKAY